MKEENQSADAVEPVDVSLPLGAPPAISPGATEIILNTVGRALERHGITECDDPGEAIDVLVEGRDRQIADLKSENERLEKEARGVSGLVEAASTALAEIESLMQEAHNNAYPVCCGRPGSECCGSPEPEWSEADQRTMDRLAPHQRSLTDALSAYREKRA